MAEKGIFRSAMSGFNKKEVLEYIDQITAAWNEERQALAAQAEEAAARAQQAEEAAAAATRQAEEAQAQAANLQEQLATAETEAARSAQELSDKASALETVEKTLRETQEALQQTQEALSAMEKEVASLTAQRDEAISAVAEARMQLTSCQEAAAGAEQQLGENARRITELERDISLLRQENSRYKAILGTAESAQQHVESIVRPFIEQANRQADETLDSVQAVLAGVLAQLGELQGNVEQRRPALRRCKSDSDSRLSAAFGDWVTQARSAAQPGDTGASGADGHFFR